MNEEDKPIKLSLWNRMKLRDAIKKARKTSERNKKLLLEISKIVGTEDEKYQKVLKAAKEDYITGIIGDKDNAGFAEIFEIADERGEITRVELEAMDIDELASLFEEGTNELERITGGDSKKK